jgi:hypothetical protein
MPFYIEAERIGLGDLLRRIQETDLVPSRCSLKDYLDDSFHKLQMKGIGTLADLRKALKNVKSIDLLARETGMDAEYLTLLRREVESYFPKAFPLSEFHWLDGRQIAQLASMGYGNTASLYEALENPGSREEMLRANKLERWFVDDIFCLTDLTRIQWVSPTAARMLFEAGCKSAEAVASANAEILCLALEEVNSRNHYSKIHIGLRDIKRLIKAASYVSEPMR